MRALSPFMRWLLYGHSHMTRESVKALEKGQKEKGENKKSLRDSGGLRL